MNQSSEEFISRFFNGAMDKDEIKELQEWINRSPKNLSEFEAYRKIWLGTAIHITDDKFDADGAWNKISGQIKNKRSESIFGNNLSLRRVLQIAAIFVVLISIGSVASWLVLSSGYTKPVNQSCEIITPQGSKSQIILPDGSTAWLNAGSKLSYNGDFNQAERVVSLVGEAYFIVKSNKEKPFVVQTAYLKVKAYGTVFNVKAYPEEKTIEATLVEGIVEIETEDKTKSEETYSYTLKPKQNIIYHIDSGVSEMPSDKVPANEIAKTEKVAEEAKLVQVKSDIKPELYTSWKDENWVVEGIPLDELAVLMGRRYNSKIEIQDNALKLYKFTGTIRNETLEQVLVILRMTTPLEYKVGKGSVTWQLDKNLEQNYSRILKR
jgi:transmembrane sensor